MVDLARLQALKQKLLHDIKLPPVWEFFMGNFADQPAFVALSDKHADEFVESVVGAIARQLWPRNPAISDLKLMRVPEHQFVHGSFFAGGKIGAVFYFEDAQAGLAAICEGPPSNEVKYVRFSGQPIQRRGDPDLN
ncbi:MAG: hypothetical protein K2W96_05185 [Gemmataceae bacterium]|nr:hypothetical protein [Gemmataceae bacterium]